MSHANDDGVVDATSTDSSATDNAAAVIRRRVRRVKFRAVPRGTFGAPEFVILKFCIFL